VATLVEKPLATSYSDGLDIVDAGNRSGRALAVGYSTRFRANVLGLKELLESQRFGAVSRFVYQFGTNGGWAPLSAYNLSRRTAGGGVLVVTGTHFLDRMLSFWGYPDEVEYQDDARGGLESNCVAAFRYRRSSLQFQGVARLSKTVDLPKGLVIETTQGTLRVADRDDAQIIFRPRDSQVWEYALRRQATNIHFEQVATSLLQLEDFVEACFAGRQPRVDGRQGLLSLRLIEEMYSHRQPLPYLP